MSQLQSHLLTLGIAGINLHFRYNGQSRITLIKPSTSSLTVVLLLQRVATQDTLLSGREAVCRIVELGPSKVLVGMAKKTLDGQLSYGAGSSVTCLSSTQDMKEICYQYENGESQELAGSDSQTSASSSPKPIPETAPPPSASPEHSGKPASPLPPVASHSTSVNMAIEDVPLSGAEIIQVLAARKLKKSVVGIEKSKSIKELCGGEYPSVVSEILSFIKSS